jgi:hypothetical protein
MSTAGIWPLYAVRPSNARTRLMYVWNSVVAPRASASSARRSRSCRELKIVTGDRVVPSTNSCTVLAITGSGMPSIGSRSATVSFFVW